MTKEPFNGVYFGTFRKKPVKIEAYLYERGHTGRPVEPMWFVDAVNSGKVMAYTDHLIIKTFEGDHRADIGDWIIRGIKGELYPCKPDIFEATYEWVR